MKKFENSDNFYAKKLSKINAPAFIYPFVIRGYKYFGDDSSKLNTLFNILEVLTFRARLINSRANIQERLNSILLNFKGDLINLKKEIKSKLNESWYWSDTNTKNYLNGGMYGNKVLNYLLWEYENSIQNKGYSIKNFSLDNEQIEHISPQTPTDGEPIATGYDLNEDREYSEDFVSKHLNSLGNLMLISGSHNASIGNKAFKNKLNSYKENPLLNQQVEIKDFSNSENEAVFWKAESIEKRHKKIVDFAIQRWSFEKIETKYLETELIEDKNK